MSFTVLIVDDEKEMCLSLSELLNTQGYETCYTTNAREVPNLLVKKTIQLILMDVRMPAMNGLTLLKQVKATDWSIPIIMISGYASVECIVEAMKYGAHNFYEKPLNLMKLVEEIGRIKDSRKNLNGSGRRTQIVTQNPRMKEIIRIIEKTAATEASVIITGESGTGKELVANSIHYLSHRKDHPFVKLNCAAIPDTLLESELFGHEQGAFTDAKSRRTGKFEQAEGGSIFFDEIGDMSINTQAKLLRVLQEREFERIGGSEMISADVRIIAATHHNIKDLIFAGKFREDLFYRLSVINIELPPLRERIEDVVPLANQLLKDFCLLYHKNLQGFSKEVRSLFFSHNWPGNIRELKNCVERAVIFAEGNQIEFQDLPMQYQNLERRSSTGLDMMVESISRDMILDALEQASGKKQKAAEILNIHRKTLYNKMKKLGIE